MGTQKITFGQGGQDTDYESKLKAAKAQAPYLNMGIKAPDFQEDNPFNQPGTNEVAQTAYADQGLSTTASPNMEVGKMQEFETDPRGVGFRRKNLNSGIYGG